MAAEQITGWVLLVATSSAIVAGGYSGPLDFPLGDFAAATGLAALGSFCRAGFDAKARRDVAFAKGSSAPGFDFIALTYALTGAPLVGGVALGLIRAFGLIPDYAAVPAIMLLGYTGKDGIDLLVRIVSRIIGRKSGLEE